MRTPVSPKTPRRTAVTGIPAILILCALTVLAAAANAATLRQATAGRFDIGTAIPGSEISPAEQQLVADQFTCVTPENCMKPQPVQPIEGEFHFGPADNLVDFAERYHLKVNGHTLVWHSQCPRWFFQDGTLPAGRDLVLRRMRDHIRAVASHFRGRVASWDVVNEAIDDGGDYLRKSPWLSSIGGDFIAEAFLAARQADPGAKLFYNDYGIEQPAKRGKALRLIRELKARHAPIDGIGIQGHWSLDRIPFKEIEEAITAFQREGLKVAVTELDIDMVPRRNSGADTAQKESGADDPYANGCPPELLERQARQYARLFELFQKLHVSRVTFWGLHDGRSWLNSWPRKRTNHPLLWSRNLEPKPALPAVLSALGSGNSV